MPKLIMLADFTLSAAFLGLILAAPAQQKKNAQRSAIYILTGIVMFMFSALIKDFKVKNGGKLSSSLNSFYFPNRFYAPRLSFLVLILELVLSSKNII